MATETPMSIESIHKYIDKKFSLHLKKTQEFLRIPSVSTDKKGLQTAAAWLKEYISSMGGRVQCVGQQDAPLSIRDFKARKKKLY